MTLLDISGVGISIFGVAAFLLVTRETERAQKLGVILGYVLILLVAHGYSYSTVGNNSYALSLYLWVA